MIVLVSHTIPSISHAELFHLSTVPPLQPINHKDTYPGPSTKPQSESPCLCSSVIYALVSACSDCQGGRIERSGSHDNERKKQLSTNSTISWQTWSTKCTKPLVDL